jgi:hypothetical protein
LQTLLYNLTVRKTELGALGQETNFDFQYIPTLDLMTTTTTAGPGKAEGEVEEGEGRGSGGGVAGTKARRGGIERRNLTALLAALVTVGTVAWLGLGTASYLLQRQSWIKLR